MRKLLVTIVPLIFIFSCSDASEEISELDRCVDANIKLIRNYDLIEVFEESPGWSKIKVNDEYRHLINSDLFKLKIMLDVEMIQKSLLDLLSKEENISDPELTVIIRNVNDLSDRETALDSFEYLKGNILPEWNLNYTDQSRIYFTIPINDKGEEQDIEGMINSDKDTLFKSGDNYLPELYRSFISSTLQIADRKLLVNTAEEICYSQKIY